MTRSSLHFFFLNVGHALDHCFILIFPTVVLALENEWQLGYGELLKYGMVGVFAFGAASIPAGWLGDRWSRTGMMTVFFVGIGLASIATGLARTPLQIGLGVAFIGLFAAIYHPVGIALVFGTATRTGRALAVNGVWGNLGLAAAAGMAGLLTQAFTWRAAFMVPGAISVVVGIAYALTVARRARPAQAPAGNSRAVRAPAGSMVRVFVGIAVIATFGGLIFHAMTTALPKILEAQSSAGGLAGIGGKATVVFAFAALAQLVVGELLDRFPAKWILAAATGAQAAMLYLAPAGQGPLLIVIMLVLMFGVFGQIPINDWLVGHYSTEAWRGRFYALKYTLGLGVAVIAYWLVAQTHAAAGSFVTLYVLLGAFMTVVTVTAALLPRRSLPEAAASQRP
ncbi:MAG: MFS transporter [Gammaproteobacteria bacterium]|nr:MFS transporter [Gammaproteobacteria bacterium]